MDILISGCGIAGPALAWWLVLGGHRVTLVEVAPELRTGGYIVDFWGKGFDLAERMGILDAVRTAGYRIEELRLVDSSGRRAGGLDLDVFRRLTNNRFTSLPRGDLARALFAAVEGQVEVIFGDSIAALSPSTDAVVVNFRAGSSRRFDLVIGAEGIHSRTRDLAFGPPASFRYDLGYGFAAFTLADYPGDDPGVYLMYGEPGREVMRFTLRGGAALCLLVWEDSGGKSSPGPSADDRQLVRDRFADTGWEASRMLAGVDGAEDFYVDRVAQVRMPSWHVGRVALVGDAAFAPSFLAGQGSALAMLGAYVLAGELCRQPHDIEAALCAYERRLMPFMRRKQEAARTMARAFVPRSRAGLLLREAASRIIGRIPLADRLLGRDLVDSIDLPDYEFIG